MNLERIFYPVDTTFALFVSHPDLRSNIESKYLTNMANRGTKRKIVALSETGTPPKAARLEERTGSLCFKIHNFEALEQKRGEEFFTKPVEMFGVQWCLRLYPRGKVIENQEEDGDPWVPLHLTLMPDDLATSEVTAKFSITSPNVKTFSSHTYRTDGSRYGSSKWMKRSKLLTKLDKHGTLTIDMDLAFEGKKLTCWYPKIEKNKFLSELFSRRKTDRDVTFKVERYAIFAHENVLSLKAPMLLSIDGGNSGIKNIPDYDLYAFQAFIKYIYGLNDPFFEIEDLIEAIKDTISFADRYEVKGLRLYAESVIVDKHLSAENAASLYVCAGIWRCPLLKEAVIAIYKKDPKTVMESEGWKEIMALPELMNEIMYSIHVAKTGIDDDIIHKNTKQLTADEITQMSVGMLRDRLHEAHLDMVGARDELEQRLKEYIGLTPPSGQATAASAASNAVDPTSGTSTNDVAESAAPVATASVTASQVTARRSTTDDAAQPRAAATVIEAQDDTSTTTKRRRTRSTQKTKAVTPQLTRSS